MEGKPSKKTLVEKLKRKIEKKKEQEAEKRKRDDQEESGEDEGSENESDASDEEEKPDIESMDVSFEAHGIKKDDLFGVIGITNSSPFGGILERHPDPIAELSEYLCEKERPIGSAIHVIHDDETLSLDIFGVISALPCKALKDASYMSKILAYVEKKTPRVHAALSGASSVGLLFNNRLVNLPPQISPPLHKSFISELEAMSKSDPTYRFSHLLVISRVFKSAEVDALQALEEEAKKKAKKSDGPSAAKKQKSEPAEKAAQAESVVEFDTKELVFLMPEEEFYFMEASESQLVGAPQVGGESDAPNYNLVFLVPVSKLSRVASEIESFFPEA